MFVPTGNKPVARRAQLLVPATRFVS